MERCGAKKHILMVNSAVDDVYRLLENLVAQLNWEGGGEVGFGFLLSGSQEGNP